MKIDLSGFLNNTEEIVSFSGDLESQGVVLDNKNIEILSPIKYEGEVFKLDNDKAINIRISYSYVEPCNRCLKPTEHSINTEISGKLGQGINNLELEENDEFDDIFYYEDYQIDLEDPIKSQVILSVPMKSVCSYNCKGLCPVCGIDKNLENCDCSTEIIDPRLEKLKDFLK